ncbi:MAG: hypothetical protein H0T92_14235 [Pyrinomonadaceae bacterium]|nr:hypothetical protein [Pyrinomonadaceae bacterium]
MLAGNADLRRLWLAQVISEIGDWLNTTAVLAVGFFFASYETLTTLIMVGSMLVSGAATVRMSTASARWLRLQVSSLRSPVCYGSGCNPARALTNKLRPA